MDNEQILQQANELLQGKLKALSIDSVNHNPHPYCIGPRHVSWASDKWGGMLSEDCIRDGEKRGGLNCAIPGCSLSYDEHKSDKVLFLQLTQNMTQAEGQELLKPLADAVLIPNKIDGIALVDTPEKYRFT